MSKNSELERQNLFVEWLKARGMYNVYDSSAIMRKAHEVWEEQQKVIDSLGAKLDKAIDIIGESEDTNYFWALREIEKARKLPGENNDR